MINMLFITVSFSYVCIVEPTPPQAVLLYMCVTINVLIIWTNLWHLFCATFCFNSTAGLCAVEHLHRRWFKLHPYWRNNSKDTAVLWYLVNAPNYQMNKSTFSTLLCFYQAPCCLKCIIFWHKSLNLPFDKHHKLIFQQICAFFWGRKEGTLNKWFSLSVYKPVGFYTWNAVKRKTVGGPEGKRQIQFDRINRVNVAIH